MITEHYNDERGEQHTIRTVTIEDAKGAEYEHRFETAGDPADPDGYQYIDGDEPPESAVEQLHEALTNDE